MADSFFILAAGAHCDSVEVGGGGGGGGGGGAGLLLSELLQLSILSDIDTTTSVRRQLASPKTENLRI